MAQLYKVTEWKSGSQRWYVSCVIDLKNHSNAWWLPMRLLNLDVESFLTLLKNQYHAQNFSYNEQQNVLLYSWDNYDLAHKWTLMINREARKKQFRIG